MDNSVRPWDLLDPNEPRVPDEIQKWRFALCNSCEHFFKPTNQCKKCGCFMNLKTKLAKADCPVGKWAKHE